MYYCIAKIPGELMSPCKCTIDNDIFVQSSGKVMSTFDNPQLHQIPNTNANVRHSILWQQIQSITSV